MSVYHPQTIWNVKKNTLVCYHGFLFLLLNCSWQHMLKEEKTRKAPVPPEFIFYHCQMTEFLVQRGPHWGHCVVEQSIPTRQLKSHSQYFKCRYENRSTEWHQSRCQWNSLQHPLNGSLIPPHSSQDLHFFKTATRNNLFWWTHPCFYLLLATF